jgi:Tfp pilus assembly protein PilP
MAFKFFFISLLSYLAWNVSSAVAMDVQFSQYEQQNLNTFPQQNLVRDPFTPSRLMYEVIGSQNGLQNGAYGFIPSLQGNKIPQMKLKGFIDKDDEPLALLEIQGKGTFMVREGDEINIDPSNPRQAIRISKITRLSITVETGTLGSIRVLR